MKYFAFFLLSLTLAFAEIAPRQTIPVATSGFTISPTLPTTGSATPTAAPTQSATKTQTVPTQPATKTQTVPTQSATKTQTVPTQSATKTQTVPTQSVSKTSSVSATQSSVSTQSSVATQTSAPTSAPTTGGFVCDNDNCCADHQIANNATGEGFLRFNDRCLKGGLHCIDDSGCELCSKKENASGIFRPLCSSPLTCGTEECCSQFANQTQGQSLRVSGRCLLGGPRCFESSGCEFCATNLTNANVTFAPCDNNATCHNQMCCAARALPNPETGAGYLFFDESCTGSGSNNTADCVAKTGCKLCFRPPSGGGGNNLGNRSICPNLTDEGFTPELDSLFGDGDDPFDSSSATLLAGFAVLLGLFVARL